MLNYRNLLLESMQYDFKIEASIIEGKIPIPSATSGERIKSMIVLAKDAECYITAIKELGKSEDTNPAYFYSFKVENSHHSIDEIVTNLGKQNIQVRGIIRL